MGNSSRKMDIEKTRSGTAFVNAATGGKIRVIAAADFVALLARRVVRWN